MSGGFFRGTSADQDTRFSNKQAKLMKSQKFAPELDHLVDMSRVKVDVIRPWIANRVTELLGFEDEVLINFIYGLLDGKNVNGKQVQISLTGFMEKNTGKFMKELWTLLLSAQKNASGVPQQFLDAKEEETKQKKAEADRIANEIQKKKEKEAKELELERMRKMDGVVDISKASNAVLEPISKHMVQRASSTGPKDEQEMDERNGSRGKDRVSKSPHSADHYPSSPRGTRSGSIGKSFSNSRSYSGERHKSKSVSGSPDPRERSISSEGAYRSPRRRSMTPRRRLSPRGSNSPSGRRPSHSRRRFRSRSPRRSPSPGRRRLRSPFRHRSPSPVRRRSPSPVRRRLPSPVRRRSRSPVRRRSPSPMRRRSPPPVRRRSPPPVRRRSPSPMRRRSPSPLRRRSPSPVRRRSPSPLRRRSPSPLRRRRRRSPSTPRHRSPSPMRRRSPISSRRRSPTPSRRRSPSPYGSSSPSPVQRRSPSPVRRKSPKHQRGSPVRSSREKIRTHEKLSPVRHAPLKEKVEHPVETRRGPDSVARRPPNTLRSPQRDPKNRNDLRKRVPSWSPSPERSPVLSESPPGTRKRGASEDRRSSSPYESPVRQTRERMTRDGRQSPQKPREHKPRRDSPDTSGEGEETYYTREDRDRKPKSLQKGTTHSSNVAKQKDTPMNAFHKEEYSPERSAGGRATETRSHLDNTDLRKKNQEIKSEKNSGRVVPDRRKSPPSYKHTMLGEKQQVSHSMDSNKADEKNRTHSNNNKDSDRRYKSETIPKSVENLDLSNRVGSFDSGSKDGDKYRADVKEKRKHKRSNRHEMASDDDDSQIDERKEVKRRRKEEKKLRKEEKRRRREERRRRKEERRAEKLKGRSMDTVTPPSDSEKNQSDAYASDGEHVARRESRLSDTDEAESEQKKLEIELRKKALESLRAKKGIGH